MKNYRFALPLLTILALLGGWFGRTPQQTQAASSLAASSLAASTPVGPGGSWNLTFSDEFNGDSVDRSIWLSDLPNGGHGELHEYVNDNSHNNYVVQNGMLQIVARKETYMGQPYTSGEIDSQGRFEQKYGFFEIRARVPAGKGFWPAFWLIPNSNNWVPEIDITEILGDRPDTTYMTFHYINSSGSYVETQSVYSGADFSVGWHTFAVDWEPDVMIWYVDGIERKRITNTSIIPNMPLYPIANLGVGGSWPGSPDSSTVFPSSYDIDYIRVWQKGASSSPTQTPTRGLPSPTSTQVNAKPTATRAPTQTRPAPSATATRPPSSSPTPRPTVTNVPGKWHRVHLPMVLEP